MAGTYWASRIFSAKIRLSPGRIEPSGVPCGYPSFDGMTTATDEPAEFAEKLRLALRFSTETGRTRGRERIVKLGLDSEAVAARLAAALTRLKSAA